MAHLLIVACDRCLEVGERVEATEEFVVAFDRRNPRTLDLCGEHAKPFQELREFAESKGVAVKGGVPVSRREHAPRDTRCPVCSQMTTRQGVSSHMRMAHPGERLSCPECGREIGTAQSLAIHRQAKHGAKKRGEI